MESLQWVRIGARFLLKFPSVLCLWKLCPDPGGGRGGSGGYQLELYVDICVYFC